MIRLATSCRKYALRNSIATNNYIETKSDLTLGKFNAKTYRYLCPLLGIGDILAQLLLQSLELQCDPS